MDLLLWITTIQNFKCRKDLRTEKKASGVRERHKKICVLLSFNFFLPLSSEQRERSGMRCEDYFGNAGTVVVISD